MAYAASQNSLFDRMVRAARLDRTLYDEVDADESATTQALAVVAIASVLNAVGAAIGAALYHSSGRAVVGALIAALIGWVIWSLVVWLVGTRLMDGRATYGRMLRSLGFAYAPEALGFFQFIPLLGGLISLIASLLVLVAGFIAVREALDFTNGKTLVTVIVGWVALVVVFGVIAALLGGALFAVSRVGAV